MYFEALIFFVFSLNRSTDFTHDLGSKHNFISRSSASSRSFVLVNFFLKIFSSISLIKSKRHSSSRNRVFDARDWSASWTSDLSLSHKRAVLVASHWCAGWCTSLSSWSALRHETRLFFRAADSVFVNTLRTLLDSIIFHTYP